MKAVDGLIAAIGVVALALAAYTVVRSRQDSQVQVMPPIPSTNASAPPDSAFPSCLSKPAGLPRWRCQVAQARRKNLIRCYGQRLYYIGHTATGSPIYYPWPPQLRCWNTSVSGSG